MSSWSRRRAAVAKEAEADRIAAEEAVVAQQHAELAEKSDAEILAELGLPDPDTLVKGDDFKAFMAKAVPQHIRKRALRTLWRSNTVLACVDGLNDYDDDYLTGSTGQGALKTTYQVGKGLMAHVREMERLAELAAAPVAAAPEEAEVEAEEEAPEVMQPEDVAQVVEAADEPGAPEMPTPRRMQFHFAEDAA